MERGVTSTILHHTTITPVLAITVTGRAIFNRDRLQCKKN
jgi:hypothetical protein